MLLLNELSINPIRQGKNDACLLCSYATALFPFTSTSEMQYFVDCCNLLDITLVEQRDAISKLSPNYIDSRIGTFNAVSGYDWIEELHLNCNATSFINARNFVEIRRGMNREEVERNLSNLKSSSIFALGFSNGRWHSICVIKVPNIGLVARDSAIETNESNPLFDAYGETFEELICKLYGHDNIQIGESILFSPKNKV